MFNRNEICGLQGMLLVFLSASSILISSACGQTPASPSTPSPAAAPAAPSKTSPPTSSSASPAPAHKYQPERFAGRAAKYYSTVWGVDSLSVKWTESGEVIRFSYRVLDPEKAKILNDEKAEPQLLDPITNVRLVVPTMEKVGKLRQTAKPEAGRSYWMAFSNKGQHVRRGDHVDIVIGQFRADGLVVD